MVAGPENNNLYGRSVAITPDGTRMAIGTSQRPVINGSTRTGFVVLVYDINPDGTLTQDAAIRTPSSNIFLGQDVAISHDGRRIAAGAPLNGQSG